MASGWDEDVAASWFWGRGDLSATPPEVSEISQPEISQPEISQPEISRAHRDAAPAGNIFALEPEPEAPVELPLPGQDAWRRFQERSPAEVWALVQELPSLLAAEVRPALRVHREILSDQAELEHWGLGLWLIPSLCRQDRLVAVVSVDGLRGDLDLARRGAGVLQQRARSQGLSLRTLCWPVETLGQRRALTRGLVLWLAGAQDARLSLSGLLRTPHDDEIVSLAPRCLPASSSPLRAVLFALDALSDALPAWDVDQEDIDRLESLWSLFVDDRQGLHLLLSLRLVGRVPELADPLRVLLPPLCSVPHWQALQDQHAFLWGGAFGQEAEQEARVWSRSMRELSEIVDAVDPVSADALRAWLDLRQDREGFVARSLCRELFGPRPRQQLVLLPAQDGQVELRGGAYGGELEYRASSEMEALLWALAAGLLGPDTRLRSRGVGRGQDLGVWIKHLLRFEKQRGGSLVGLWSPSTGAEGRKVRAKKAPTEGFVITHDRGAYRLCRSTQLTDLAWLTELARGEPGPVQVVSSGSGRAWVLGGLIQKLVTALTRGESVFLDLGRPSLLWRQRGVLSRRPEALTRALARLPEQPLVALGSSDLARLVEVAQRLHPGSCLALSSPACGLVVKDDGGACYVERVASIEIVRVGRDLASFFQDSGVSLPLSWRLDAGVGSITPAPAVVELDVELRRGAVAIRVAGIPVPNSPDRLKAAAQVVLSQCPANRAIRFRIASLRWPGASAVSLLRLRCVIRRRLELRLNRYLHPISRRA